MTFKEAKSSGAGPEPPIMQAPVGFPALSTQRKDTQEFLPALQVSVDCGVGAALETGVQGLTFWQRQGRKTFLWQ